MMNRKIFVALLVAMPMISPVLAGTLEGTVTVTGARNNADAVVYVSTIAGKTFAPPEKPSEMDQRDMTFVPHVLPVVVGTQVDFKNGDPVLHNVFSPDKCADGFNLGSWPQGQIRSHTFDEECAATILCNVHPEMEAFVVAVPTPYFAVTDRSGAYSISGLPDGTYTVKVWHPKRKGTETEVTVSGDTEVNFEIKR
ncbi:MAG: carboxypeptidase regulatory-like domain-containing protein [Acidobacteriota bacterium]